MSLPDHLLDDDDRECSACGKFLLRWEKRQCRECEAESIDLYADARLQDAKEGKHG